MNNFLSLVILYLIGVGGYFAFKKLNLPLPALLGSLAITSVIALLGLFPQAPTGGMSAICKIVMGIIVGRRINRQSVKILRKIVYPALLVSIWMVLLSIFLGFLLTWLSGVPLSTGLIGAATGGVNEMAIFAISMHYDAATVTIISATRLVTVLVLTPWLATKWTENLNGGARKNSTEAKDAEITLLTKKITGNGICLLMICSVFGGYLFEMLKVPAGFMLGSFFFSGLFSLVSDMSWNIPPAAVNAAQIGLGIAIGEYFGPQQMRYLLDIRFIASLAACTAFSIMATLTCAFLLQKITKWDPLTCLLSTSPGGLSQMIVVSEEMNADSLIVGILHLARYLVIVSCMPVIIKLVLT
jgi:membrane AbrB-like protein